MQLVRVMTGRYETTFKRKLTEIKLAKTITKNFNILQLAEVYLSNAYFGWQMSGIKEAAKKTGIDYKCITDSEAALLIARLKYPQPRLYSNTHTQKLHYRKNYILKKRQLLENRPN